MIGNLPLRAKDMPVKASPSATTFRADGSHWKPRHVRGMTATTHCDARPAPHQRDEGIKIFDLDLEEQAKNLLHAKCVMVPDKLTTRCPHFSVGPARTGTRTTWIRHGLFLTRSNFPHRHGKTHQHAWESFWGAGREPHGVPGILFINISQSYVHVRSRHLPQMIFNRRAAQSMMP
ncbi:hypothetical protein Lal_00046857 [Lupinus albus]|nr:hypothetical protein Lal_00046857 [Lupinus albus]